MEHIGAGLAALGVIGPGIGIGILAGMSAAAIGRNPDAAGQIRGLAIILAAFAEGLGVLAVVVGLLAIFIQPQPDRSGTERPTWTSWPSRPAPRRGGSARRRGEARRPDDQPVLGHRQPPSTSCSSSPSSGRSPSSRSAGCSPTAGGGSTRASRTPRAPASRSEASAAAAADEIAAARREASEILDRAQRVAQETREADIAATREELERMRVRAAAEIEAEKGRAIADLRAEVADLALAAAGRVVGEIHDGRAPAPPRRGVPRRVAHRRRPRT